MMSTAEFIRKKAWQAVMREVGAAYGCDITIKEAVDRIEYELNHQD